MTSRQSFITTALQNLVWTTEVEAESTQKTLDKIKEYVRWCDERFALYTPADEAAALDQLADHKNMVAADKKRIAPWTKWKTDLLDDHAAPVVACCVVLIHACRMSVTLINFQRWADPQNRLAPRPGTARPRGADHPMVWLNRDLQNRLRGTSTPTTSPDTIASERFYWSVYWENSTLLTEQSLMRLLLRYTADRSLGVDAANDVASIVRISRDDGSLLRRIYRWYRCNVAGHEVFLERCLPTDRMESLEGGRGPGDAPPRSAPPAARRPDAVEDADAFTYCQNFFTGTVLADVNDIRWAYEPFRAELVYAVAQLTTRPDHAASLRVYWAQKAGQAWPDEQRLAKEQVAAAMMEIARTVNRASTEWTKEALADPVPADAAGIDHIGRIVNALVPYAEATDDGSDADVDNLVRSMVTTLLVSAFATFQMAEEVSGVTWMDENFRMDHANDLKNRMEQYRRLLFASVARRTVTDPSLLIVLRLLKAACDIGYYAASDYTLPASPPPARISVARATDPRRHRHQPAAFHPYGVLRGQDPAF